MTVFCILFYSELGVILSERNAYFGIYGLVFSDVGDNVDVTGLDENPIFVNPTVGDYRIRPGCGFFDIEIEKMGRY